jgi:hypothetical protein
MFAGGRPVPVLLVLEVHLHGNKSCIRNEHCSLTALLCQLSYLLRRIDTWNQSEFASSP